MLITGDKCLHNVEKDSSDRPKCLTFMINSEINAPSHTHFSKIDRFCIKHFTSCRQSVSLCVIGHSVTFPILNMLLKFPYQIFTFFMQEESEQE